MGGASCSGALLNTTAKDNRNVFLTADHCFVSTPSNQWIFYWHYEAPACGGNANTDPTRSTAGATILDRRMDTDFMLLELIGDPKQNGNIRPYYLGWDRSTIGAVNPVGIHHPRKSPKKISLSVNKPVYIYPSSIRWNDANGNYLSTTPANTHWEVVFNYGATEGGSSGSPLLNQHNRVVGQLHGGARMCPSLPDNVVKYYGRFGLSWSGGGSNSTRLSNWLDPRGTNPQYIDGMAPLSPTLICYGSANAQVFSTFNWQTGYYWDKSSNLTLSNAYTDGDCETLTDN